MEGGVRGEREREEREIERGRERGGRREREREREGRRERERERERNNFILQNCSTFYIFLFAAIQGAGSSHPCL